MIPTKTKMIRKKYRAVKQHVQDIQYQTQGLIQKLQSSTINVQQQALAMIANLNSIPSFFNHPQFVQLLISYLYLGNIDLSNSTLFALNNLCEINRSMVDQLFHYGLDKALISLNTDCKQLLYPLILLMTNICNHIPPQFRHLVITLQTALSNINHLTNQDYQIILQFLSESKYKVTSIQIINKLFAILNDDHKYKPRSLAMVILLNSTNENNQQQIYKQVMQYINEMIVNVDLESEYRNNFNNKKQQELVEEQMVEEMLSKTQGHNKIQNNTAYDLLLDCVEGLQKILHTIISLDQEWEQDSQSDQQNQLQDVNIIVEQSHTKNKLVYQTQLFLINNIKSIAKNTILTFQQGCIINQLALRLILKLQIKQNNQLQQYLCYISIKSILNSIQNQYFEQISSVNVQLALQITLKYKKIAQRHTLIDILQRLKMGQIWKKCWINTLQLISIFYNPEVNIVKHQQNLRIGNILKKIIVQLPYTQLQEWRCQTIDTLFDVYSNQNFDQNFIELGLMKILQFVYAEGIKQKINKKKRSKFVLQILGDLKRFIEYKRKMIKI